MLFRRLWPFSTLRTDTAQHDNTRAQPPFASVDELLEACQQKDWSRLAGQEGISDARALWKLHPVACQQWLTILIREADQMRDCQAPADAARFYQAAFALAPWRLDLGMQLGNMLKDSGQLETAEDIYRSLITQAPEEAETYLQLGHVYKIQGRRLLALNHYRAALKRDPFCEAAHRELFLAGDTAAQQATASHRHLSHGTKQGLHLAATLADMRRRLDDMASVLPDISTFSAFPSQDYAIFRKLFCIPPPPPATPRPLTVIITQNDVSDAVSAAQMAALGSMPSVTTLYTIGASPTLQDAWGTRMRSGLSLIHLPDAALLPSTIPPSLDGQGAGSVLLIGQNCIPSPLLADWTACAVEISNCDIVFCDAETLISSTSSGALFEATALQPRPAADPIWLEQEDTIGDAIVLSADLWPAYRGKSPVEIVRGGLSAGLLIAHVPYPLVASPEASDRPTRSSPHPLPERFVIHDLPAPCTVIICTRDNAADCCRMVDSLFATARHPERIHCRVVDNGTRTAGDLILLDQLVARHPRVTLLRDPAPFNWSRLNNDAAAGISTPNILFCNDDMQMLSEGWDVVLAGLLRSPETGAVGARLLYSDDTIQHAGVLLGWQGSVIHDGLYEPRDSNAHFGRWQCTRQASAVTGAFLGIRTEVFAASGGFDAERMPVSYSDIDLCLRLQESGLQILWTPLIEVRHDESASRGLDHLNPLRHSLATTERAAFENIWGTKKLSMDPTVNPVWVDATLPLHLIRPVSPAVALRRIRET